MAYGESIVMEPTLEEALRKVFEETAGRPRPITPEPTEPTIPIEGADDINELIIRANNVFDRSTEAQREGNWAEYGKLIEELEEILKRLGELNTIENIENVNE